MKPKTPKTIPSTSLEQMIRLTGITNEDMATVRKVLDKFYLTKNKKSLYTDKTYEFREKYKIRPLL